MTAVERVQFYSALKSEASLESMPEKKPPPFWPTSGDIVIKNVDASYSITGEPLALRRISLKIADKEKIGIVGRTGAGKTTFVSMLFRLVEPIGKIKIDGINISRIGLHDLRNKLSIIPQDPLMFTGTIKKNLDPFSYHSDLKLYGVLEDVQMKDVVLSKPDGLNAKVSEGGYVFSTGERQLLCIARAILRKSRILIMDEATANIDNRTDGIIQQTIREKFKDCTVVTVAHRLQTVIDNDRIMVLQSGQVVEFDTPYNLLKNENSALYNLIKSTGKTNQDLMVKIAQNCHEKKMNEALKQSGISFYC